MRLAGAEGAEECRRRCRCRRVGRRGNWPLRILDVWPFLRTLRSGPDSRRRRRWDRRGWCVGRRQRVQRGRCAPFSDNARVFSRWHRRANAEVAGPRLRTVQRSRREYLSARGRAQGCHHPDRRRVAAVSGCATSCGRAQITASLCGVPTGNPKLYLPATQADFWDGAPGTAEVSRAQCHDGEHLTLSTPSSKHWSPVVVAFHGDRLELLLAYSAPLSENKYRSAACCSQSGR